MDRLERTLLALDQLLYLIQSEKRFTNQFVDDKSKKNDVHTIKVGKENSNVIPIIK